MELLLQGCQLFIQIGGVDARRLHGGFHLFELFCLALQRLGGLVDLRLLRQELVFKVAGIGAGLGHLLLDVVVLLLEKGQFLGGFLDGCLLLLKGLDISGLAVKGLNLFLQRLDLF